MAIGFALCAILMAFALWLGIRRLPADLKALRTGPTGRVLDLDDATEAFRAGPGRDRPADDRTVDTAVAMLWFALVEAGAWVDARQAEAILAERGALRQGTRTFAEVDGAYRGGDLDLAPFRPDYRAFIADFVVSRTFHDWFEDRTQFDLDPWELYELRRDAVLGALRKAGLGKR
jgi:hypothetical protein